MLLLFSGRFLSGLLTNSGWETLKLGHIYLYFSASLLLFGHFVVFYVKRNATSNADNAESTVGRMSKQQFSGVSSLLLDSSDALLRCR